MLCRVTMLVAIAAVLLSASLSSLAAQDASSEPACSASGATRGAAEAASPPATATSTATAAAMEAATAAPDASPTPHGCTIEMRIIAFNPAKTEIPVGTTVTWTNHDTVPHTATATERTFDSGILDPGKSFNFTFAKPGTYVYSCLIRPSMKGTLVVHRPARTDRHRALSNDNSSWIGPRRSLTANRVRVDRYCDQPGGIQAPGVRPEVRGYPPRGPSFDQW
jgi:plastocyanin